MSNKRPSESSFSESAPGKRSHLGWIIGIIITLVILVIGSSIFAYYRYTEQSQHPIATSHTAAPNDASLASMNATQLYQYVLSTPPSLTDLSDSSHADYWDHYMQNGSGCQFKNKAFYVMTTPPLDSPICYLRNEFLRNFAFQVQVQFGAANTQDQLQGGGIFFRAHLIQQEGYTFEITTQSETVSGTTLVANNTSLVVNQKSVPTPLHSWPNDTPNTMTALNVLTIIAVGDKINLYINKHALGTIADTTFQGGQIGLLALSTLTPFSIAYQNMKLWRL